MDVLDSVPRNLLGYEIKTRAQIIFTFLIPVCLELVTYLIQTSADIAVTVQHFRLNHPFYGGLTLTFICLPAIVCFISIMTSPWQWPEVKGCNPENLKFFFLQLFNFLLFPIGALHRFCRRIFWSIESLFYGKETYERQHSVSKAAETSPFELYHFVQAYTQAAPQIILQLYILLREDIFRNYETTNVQVLSVVFSLINVAVITMSYQRFESQKIVGRHYPWSSPLQIQNRQREFRRTRSHVDEIREKAKSRIDRTRNFPENEAILQRFHSQQQIVESTSILSSPAAGETNSIRSEFSQENGKSCEGNKKILEHSGVSILPNITDDEKLSSCQNWSNSADEVDVADGKTNENAKDWDSILVLEEISISSLRVQEMDFDTVPDTPAPSPPLRGKLSDQNSTNVSIWQQYLNRMKRLSTYKDMLITNAELYIKDHVPHPPRILLERTLSRGKEDERSENTCPRHDYKNVVNDVSSKQQMNLSTRENDNKHNLSGSADLGDTTDFFLPKRRKTIKGVEQDDFVGKCVSFFGWIMFIFMRMISLSVFSYFYLEEFLYLIGTHYFLMLLCLIYESKFQKKVERLLFYFFLAYVYIFVILEFRIKFKHLRQWYFGYFALVMLQNFIATILWYVTKEFDSWWFHYLFNAIMASGILCIACMIVYYCILKPNDVILLDTEEE